jgi:putative SOS response-associated peptidase YedK
MCSRFSLISVGEFLAKRFDVEIDATIAPHYNIAPSQEIVLITQSEPKKFTKARWGLVPSWSTDGKSKFINARAESLLTKASFKDAFLHSRCLIPADGFYEWKAAGKVKVPYRITLADKGLFAFAGIYEPKTGTAAIITTEPNSVVAKLHDRMPVVLQRDNERKYLEDDSDAKDLLVPYSEEMQSFQVSRIVNKPENDVPDVIIQVNNSQSYL